jgi:hypothetical protein
MKLPAAAAAPLATMQFCLATSLWAFMKLLLLQQYSSFAWQPVSVKLLLLRSWQCSFLCQVKRLKASLAPAAGIVQFFLSSVS